MATMKEATGNVLNTLVATSTTVCDTLNTVGKGAKYASRQMDYLLLKQEVALKADLETFENSYAETAAMQLTQQRNAINKWVAENPGSKEIYEQSLAQIRAAIAK